MFDEHLKSLGIKSPIQRKAVEILGGLQGYSKRLDLLHDQLQKEFSRGGNAPSRIKQKLSELVELRLAKEKPGIEGVRLVLNKDIWDLPPNVIEFVRRVTEYFANEIRSDAQFHGVLKAVKSEIRNSGRLQEDIGHSVFNVLVTCALRRHHDWNFENGQIVRKVARSASNRSTPTQQELPFAEATSNKISHVSVAHTESIIQQVQHIEAVLPSRTRADTDLLPRNIDFVSVTMESIFPATLVAEFGRESIRFFGSTAIIKVPLSLGRGQRVYVTLRFNAVNEKVFWLFSICGLSDPVQKSITDIVWHNNECVPFKVTFLDMSTGMHIGVCHTVTTDGDWEKRLSGIVRNLAAFGDRIEELYWSQDEF